MLTPVQEFVDRMLSALLTSIAQYVIVYQVILVILTTNVIQYQKDPRTLADPPLVDRIVSAPKLATKPHVLAYQDTLEVRQIVGRNVWLIPNAHQARFAYIKSALILVQEFVDLVLSALQKIIIPYVIVYQVILGIRITDALQSQNLR